MQFYFIAALAAFVSVNGHVVLQNDQPTVEKVNQALASAVPMLNSYLQKDVFDEEIALFGKDDNRIDPIDFNKHAYAHSEGSACLPEKCVTVFGKKICTPKACAGGKAEAELIDLNGLSTLLVGPIVMSSVDVDAHSHYVTGSGTFDLTCDNLSGGSHVAASAQILGQNIPVSASGSIGIDGVTPKGNVDIELFYTYNSAGRSVYTITALTLNNLQINYQKIDVNIHNLGAFNSFLSNIVTGLKDLVNKFFSVDGALSKELEQQLNDLIKDNLPAINAKLHELSF